MDKKNKHNNYKKAKIDKFIKNLYELNKEEKMKLEINGTPYKPKASNKIYNGIEFGISKNKKGFMLKGILQNEEETSELVNKLKIAKEENQNISAGIKLFEINQKTDYSNNNAKYTTPQIYHKLQFSNGKNKTYGIKLDYLKIGTEKYNFLKRNIKEFKKKEE